MRSNNGNTIREDYIRQKKMNSCVAPKPDSPNFVAQTECVMEQGDQAQGPKYCKFYKSQRGCDKKEACPYVHSEDYKPRLPSPQSQKTQKAKPQLKPKICKFFLQGNCSAGSSCEYLHVNNNTAICRFYANGTCKDGDTCRYRHVNARPPSYILPSPQFQQTPQAVPQHYRQGPQSQRQFDGTTMQYQVPHQPINQASPQGNVKMCSYFNSPGGCKSGAYCKFSHSSGPQSGTFASCASLSSCR